MRIMLMWPTDRPEIQILIDALAEDGHEIVYWVGVSPAEQRVPRGTIFHDHFAAWEGKPAQALRDTSIAPPSEVLVRSMFETESLILSMMNKRFDTLPVDERKHIYYSMLGYWSHVLDEYKPDFILYEQIPHSLYSNIVYDLARKKNIPTLCFEDTWVAHRLLAYRDYEKGSEDLQKKIKELREAHVEEKDLSDEMRAYFSSHTGATPHVPPPYMLYQKKTNAGLGLLRHRLGIAAKAFLNGSIFILSARFISRIFSKNLRTEHSRYQKAPDWSGPFVYFPMHFQPERTTTPQGGIYHDQILVIETLSAALPEGWEIYVKEHPSQWWLRTKERYSSSRYRGYYERLARIPKVRLVPITTDTFELTKRSKTVAVITGTAGWEGILIEKCPLVFGIPWWRDAPGVFRVDSVDSCRRAFGEILKGVSVPHAQTLRYLKALEAGSIHAYLENPHEENLALTAEKSMQNITVAIQKVLTAH